MDQELIALRAEVARLTEENTIFRMTNNEQRKQIDRLREALSWAVGFIECQMPNKSKEYPSMRNAQDLIKANSLYNGEFEMMRIKAELYENVVKQVKTLLEGY